MTLRVRSRLRTVGIALKLTLARCASPAKLSPKCQNDEAALAVLCAGLLFHFLQGGVHDVLFPFIIPNSLKCVTGRVGHVG